MCQLKPSAKRECHMHIRVVTRLTLGVLALIPVVASSAQQTARNAQQQGSARAERSPALLRLDQYLDWEDVQDPQLSPDGKLVIYTRRWIDKVNDQWTSSVWIMGADGSKN